MFSKLFQWDEFLTPTLARLFFLLAVVLIGLGGLGGIFTSLSLMGYSFFQGLISLIMTFIGVGVGILLARMTTEMILITFKINENLEVIRHRGDEM